MIKTSYKRIRSNKMKNERKGFTLIELLVVILIIGVLAGIAIPQYRKVKMKAELSQMLVYMDAMKKSVKNYYIANRSYPTDITVLDAGLEQYAIELGASKWIANGSSKYRVAFFKGDIECMVHPEVIACINKNFYVLRFHDHISEQYRGQTRCTYSWRSKNKELSESICKSIPPGTVAGTYNTGYWYLIGN